MIVSERYITNNVLPFMTTVDMNRVMPMLCSKYFYIKNSITRTVMKRSKSFGYRQVFGSTSIRRGHKDSSVNLSPAHVLAWF